MVRIRARYFPALLLWTGALFIALETWARYTEWRLIRQVPNVEHHYAFHDSACLERNQALLRDVLGADQVVFDQDLRVWQELLKAPSLDAWQQRADEHQEVVLFLDGTRTIHTRLLPRSMPPELSLYAARFETGQPLEAALPRNTIQDLAAALDMAAPAIWQFRIYPVPLARPYGTTVFQFAFSRIDKLTQTVPSIQDGFLVIVRLSIWKELWFSLRPGIKQAFESLEHINSLGWRSEEITLPKPPRTFRIVCVGGSTTYEGPHNALTWPALLQRHLRESTGLPIEVVNAGIVALDSFGEGQHAEDYLALEPDLILHYNFVNDMDLVMAGIQADPVSFRRLKSLLRRLAGMSLLIRQRLDRFLLGDDASIDRALNLTFHHRDFLRNAARKKGVPIAFCTFARPDPRIPPEQRALIEQRLHTQFWGQGLTLAQYCRIVDRYNERLRRYCAEHHLPLLDIAPHLSGGAERYIDYCHMRPWAIDEKARLIGECLLPLLRELRLRPENPATPPDPEPRLPSRPE